MKRKGVTLIEALFVLGIMAILIGMIMVLYSQSSEATKINATKAELAYIVQTVQSLWANDTNNQNDYNQSALTQALHDLNPSYSDGSTITFPLHGVFGTGPMGTGQFNITLYYVDKESCVLLSQIDMSQTANAAEINDMATTNGTPFDANTATSNCNATNNHVGWNFQF